MRRCPGGRKSNGERQLGFRSVGAPAHHRQLTLARPPADPRQQLWTTSHRRHGCGNPHSEPLATCMWPASRMAARGRWPSRSTADRARRISERYDQASGPVAAPGAGPVRPGGAVFLPGRPRRASRRAACPQSHSTTFTSNATFSRLSGLRLGCLPKPRQRLRSVAFNGARLQPSICAVWASDRSSKYRSTSTARCRGGNPANALSR
jgi:hypothetical protein